MNEPTPFSEAYERRYERTGMDPAGIFRNQTCSNSGHVEGCPCRAGGDPILREGWIAYEEDGFTIEVEVIR